jgi:hypothetical protein
MESNNSLPCLQGPASAPFIQPKGFSPHPYNIFKIIVTISIYAYLCQVIVPSVFQPKIFFFLFWKFDTGRTCPKKRKSTIAHGKPQLFPFLGHGENPLFPVRSSKT